MIRSIMAVLALVILSGFIVPPPAEAQEQTPTHEVREGDTLWKIAQQYYGNGGLWNRIFEANRDRLSDPAALEVGLVLSIPGAEAPPAQRAEAAADVFEEAAEAAEEAEPAPAAEVGRVEVHTPDPARAPQADPREAVGPKPIDRRTTFYPDTTNPTLRNAAAPMLSAVSPDAVFSAPWLVPEGAQIPHLGRVVDFAGSEGHVTVRSSAHPHDELLIEFDGPTPSVGSLMHVYREKRDALDLGKVVAPTGVVRITALQPSGAVAEVLKLYDRLMLEDLVGALPAYGLAQGQRAEAAAGGAEVEIIGFAMERPIYSIGDIAFLDAVSDASVGDEFVVVYDQGAGWTGNAEGRLQVVRVGADHLTARILAEERPVFGMGVRVRLDRRMR